MSSLPSYDSFTDVYGLEDDVLDFTPQPVIACLLVYPTKKIKKVSTRFGNDEKIFYLIQTIGNACGTIGMIHAITNNANRMDLEPNGLLRQYMLRNSKLSPKEKGESLENDELILGIHKESASEGQSVTLDNEASFTSMNI